MAHSTDDYQSESEHEECFSHLEVDSDDMEGVIFTTLRSMVWAQRRISADALEVTS